MRKTARRLGGLRPGHVKLERALSKLGLASRTEARKLIESGQVKVEQQVVRDPARGVRPETARIEIAGKKVEAALPRTILLHKPRGVVTTRSDEKGRPTVYSLLSDVSEHLVPVGRLDMATTGLLLLTNDTRLSAWLTDPENAIPRTYLVTVRGELTEEDAAALREGVLDEGALLKADEIVVRKASSRESHLVVTLTEGKNREIRRMLLAQGHEVTRLKRIAFGDLALDEGLQPGKWREVNEEELVRAFPRAPLKKRKQDD